MLHGGPVGIADRRPELEHPGSRVPHDVMVIGTRVREVIDLAVDDVPALVRDDDVLAGATRQDRPIGEREPLAGFADRPADELSLGGVGVLGHHRPAERHDLDVGERRR